MANSPLMAIKEYCFRCSGDSKFEVKRCSSNDCPLFAFRFGRNPYRKGREMTEEEKAKAAERLAKAREGRK